MAAAEPDKRADRTPDTPEVICCIGCDYDLRGLDVGSACPECGTPISESASDDPFDARESVWPIHSWCLRCSWLMTLVGLALLAVVPLIAWARASERGAAWLLPLWGAASYGGAVILAYTMAYIGRDMPVSWFVQHRLSVRWARACDRIYMYIINLILLGVSMFILAFALVAVIHAAIAAP